MNLKKNRWALPAFALLLCTIMIVTMSIRDHYKAGSVVKSQAQSLQVAEQP